MNLGELIEEFRSITDDYADPPMFSNDELRSYFNEAEVEACQRAKLIKDSTTDGICKISVSSGEPSYDLDERVLGIMRVKSDIGYMPIEPVKFGIMDRQNPGWETHEGEITNYVVGMDSRKIRFYSIPTQDQVVTVSVWRGPLSDMVKPNDCPEIPSLYHRKLINWALFRGYSKKDVEVNEENLAALYLSRFEKEFGKKESSSAQEEEWNLSIGYSFNDGRY